MVIPVRNDALNLAACLATVKGWVDAILVVDSHSNDGTEELCSSLGVELIQFSWDGGPEKKRNWVLRTYPFHTKWVFFLDADERCTPAFWSELRLALTSRVNGFELRYLNHFCGSPLRFGDPQRKNAVVRLGFGAYETVPPISGDRLDMEVHEHLLIKGRAGLIRSRLIHNDFKGVGSWFEKHLQYAAWEGRRVRTASGDVRARQRLKYRVFRSVWFPFAYFLYSYLLRLGFLDGKPGLLFHLAKLSYFLQVAVRIQGERQEK